MSKNESVELTEAFEQALRPIIGDQLPSSRVIACLDEHDALNDLSSAALSMQPHYTIN